MNSSKNAMKMKKDWTGHYLDFKAMAVLLPLWQEIQRHDDKISNGGALHIVTEDGNYEDDCIQFCIDYITSGEYREYTLTCYINIEEMDADIQRQLDIALALKEIPENARELVCNGCGITEELFDHLFNSEVER